MRSAVSHDLSPTRERSPHTQRSRRAGELNSPSESASLARPAKLRVSRKSTAAGRKSQQGREPSQQASGRGATHPRSPRRSTSDRESRARSRASKRLSDGVTGSQHPLVLVEHITCRFRHSQARPKARPTPLSRPSWQGYRSPRAPARAAAATRRPARDFSDGPRAANCDDPPLPPPPGVFPPTLPHIPQLGR